MLKLWKKAIKALASLKLAVIVILGIATLTAVGTFVEAEYNAQAASKLVYRTPWMFAVLGLLSVNLIAVMIDRWPWRPKHIGFVMAHIGILILLFGSWVTYKFGIDGSMRFPISGSARHVVIPDTEVVVYSSFDGDNFTRIFSSPVDFFLKAPSEQKPFRIPIMNEEIRIIDYKKYVQGLEKIVASSDPKAGVALRFRLHNDRVNLSDWLMMSNPTKEKEMSLGPARLVLTPHLEEYLSRPQLISENKIVFAPNSKDEKKIDYAVLSVNEKYKTLRGSLTEGESFLTPWMGLNAQVLRYFPKAKREYDLKTLERPVEGSTSAIKLVYKGKEYWVRLGESLKLFSEDAAYLFHFAQQLIDIGEPIKLLDFSIGRYQGTMRAMSYQSLVQTQNNEPVLISMNEPMEYKGLRFYQASFEEGDSGQPVASILSVNYDPGRWLKYLGSLFIVLGSIHLFWFKNREKKRQQIARTQG